MDANVVSAAAVVNILSNFLAEFIIVTGYAHHNNSNSNKGLYNNFESFASYLLKTSIAILFVKVELKIFFFMNDAKAHLRNNPSQISITTCPHRSSLFARLSLRNL